MSGAACPALLVAAPASGLGRNTVNAAPAASTGLHFYFPSDPTAVAALFA